jgi:hypothetical protein
MSGKIPMQNQDPTKSNPSDNNFQEAIKDLGKAEQDLGRAQAAELHAEEEIRNVERELQRATERGCEIYFFLDGEREVTHQRELTPNEIIVQYGHKDPATHYLIQIEDGREVHNYKDKGNTPIQMKDGAHYQMICTGPTPVSDGRPKTGVDAFIEGLIELGYAPALRPNTTDHVYFDYVVPAGKYLGRIVKLGFVVPVDFPFSIPSGPHVSPSIHPLKPESGTHPLHGVHANRFTTDDGDWQYWSRPFSDWKERKKTVATYMSHIRHLWETQ